MIPVRSRTGPPLSDIPSTIAGLAERPEITCTPCFRSRFTSPLPRQPLFKEGLDAGLSLHEPDDRYPILADPILAEMVPAMARPGAAKPPTSHIGIMRAAARANPGIFRRSQAICRGAKP